ncbi:hypothetical protein MNBD_DELTA04-1302 [hydrothermal vent metagenome]|uniref:Uncharacterized protein n=1 Tax=hydrothermal vent metagenome TaxID=652676 RepID=A0A3B0V0W9_9ZZZZ
MEKRHFWKKIVLPLAVVFSLAVFVTVTSAGEQAGKWETAGKKIKAAAAAVGQATKDTVHKVWSETKTESREVYEKTRSKSGKIWNRTREESEETWEAAKSKTRKVLNRAKTSIHEATAPAPSSPAAPGGQGQTSTGHAAD